MGLIRNFTRLTPPQRHAYFAALGGWTLDAFDFFIFIVTLHAIGRDFHTSLTAVSFGITLTLAMRPLGALLFGWLAEKYGRRPILMANVLSYAVIELASAFAPNLAVLLALRALFGLAILLALGLDGLLVGAQRLLTPWPARPDHPRSPSRAPPRAAFLCGAAAPPGFHPLPARAPAGGGRAAASAHHARGSGCSRDAAATRPGRSRSGSGRRSWTTARTTRTTPPAATGTGRRPPPGVAGDRQNARRWRVRR